MSSEFVVGGKYRIVRKIGSGSYGEVHLAVDITNGEEVAVKVEPLAANTLHLSYEFKIYKILRDGYHIPRIRWFGQERGHSALVMDLLGPSLEDLFNACSRRFSVKTVIMLAYQMIVTMQYIHSKNLIHRDIKPENFLMGTGCDWKDVFTVDFGMAKLFRDIRSLEHIPFREGKTLVGTARYASVNAHRGVEMSRRDDMESLGYVLVYFVRGGLPWQRIEAATKQQRLERMSEIKMNTKVEDLCRGFPEEFATYLNYCRGLGFEEVPNYPYLCHMFQTLAISLDYDNSDPLNDGQFDWAQLKKEQVAAIRSPFVASWIRHHYAE